jgi:hypothetical protein
MNQLFLHIISLEWGVVGWFVKMHDGIKW